MTRTAAALATFLAMSMCSLVVLARDEQDLSKAAVGRMLTAHSKLYRSYDSTVKLGETRTTVSVQNTPVALPKDLRLKDFIRQRACNADTVIIGAVEHIDSALTESRSFIFS